MNISKDPAVDDPQELEQEPSEPSALIILEPTEDQEELKEEIKEDSQLIPKEEPTPVGQEPKEVVEAPKIIREKTIFSIIPFYDFYLDLCDKFDGAFVTLLITQNLNQGLWHMVILATQDYFKVYLKLDPGVMTGYMSLVMLPWSVKILYGLISDNVPLFGTKRKSYVILMGIIESVSLLTIFVFNVKSGFAVTCLLGCTSLCLAFINVVVDAIMCIQARKDPTNGSQDLMSIAWMAQGIGGITGCIGGGYLTEYCDPKWTYLIMSGMGFIIAINGAFLTQECEEEEDQEGREQNKFWENLKKNLSQIGMALSMPEIYLVLTYFILNGLFSPSFGQFNYFFMLNVAHITKFQFAMFGVISKACHILGTMYYKQYLKHIETRTIIFWSTTVAVCSTFLSWCFAMRWNQLFGISDLIFIVFTDVVFGCLSLALNVLPCLALFAKITPPGIEGTIFAFLTGSWNFADGVLSPMVGTQVNNFFGHVTAKDLTNYPRLKLISFICSFIGFVILPLIPLKKDIEKIQEDRRIANELKVDSAQPQENDIEGLKKQYKQRVPDAGPLGSSFRSDNQAEDTQSLMTKTESTSIKTKTN